MGGSGGEGRRLRVFLCHASEDDDAVLRLVRQLESVGVEAWVDDRDLLGGQDWRLEIGRALARSDAVLACLSHVSLTKEGYVQKELRLALALAEEKPADAQFLVPVLLDECRPERPLADYHWVRLGDPEGFARLCRALAARATKVGARPPTPQEAPTVKLPKAGGRSVLVELTVPEKRILLGLLEVGQASRRMVASMSGVHIESARRCIDRLAGMTPSLVKVVVQTRRGPVEVLSHELTEEGRRVALRLQSA